MASFFDEYEYDVNDFNVRYGINFSFEAFETSHLRLDNMASNFHSNSTSSDRVNNLYKSTLLNLYKEYVERTLLGRSDSSEEESLFGDEVRSPSEFVKDFEEMMDIYRRYCIANNRTSPHRYGAMKSGVALMNDMKAKVSEIRGEGTGLIDKTEYIKQQYLAGKMPLRKMRGELEQVSENKSPDSVSVGRLINYMRAIDQARKERSFFAKLNPLNWPRMYAENRDYAAINNFIVDYNERQPRGYMSAVNRADAQASLDPFHESIDLAIEDIKEREQEKRLEKERVHLDPNLNNSEEPSATEKIEVNKIEEIKTEEIKTEEETVVTEPAVGEPAVTNSESHPEESKNDRSQPEEPKIEEEARRKAEEDARAEQERRNLRDAKKSIDEAVKNAVQEHNEQEKQKELQEKQEKEAANKKAFSFFSRNDKTKEKDTVGPVPTKEAAMALYESESTKEETLQLITDAMQKIYDNAIYKNHFDIMFDVTKVTLYSSLNHNLSSCWSEFEESYREESKENVLKKYAIKEFKSAFIGLDFFTYGISESKITNADRWYIAQKIADIKLNRYYPVASNSKYAKFGQNYFTQHPDHEFLARWFPSKEEIEKAVVGVTEEINNEGTKMEAPKIDYSIIDLVTEQKAAEEAKYAISYEAKARQALGQIHPSIEIHERMVDIVNNPDITPERAKEFVNQFDMIHEHSLMVRVNEHMDEEVSEEKRPSVMAGGAQHVFHEIYVELRNKFIFENTVDRVIAAQKIADMLLTAYTPVGFEPEKYLQYGDNYVLNNVDILREEMEDTYADCAENDETFAEFLKDLEAARLGKPRVKDDEETERTEDEIENSEDDVEKENDEVTVPEDADNDNDNDRELEGQ